MGAAQGFVTKLGHLLAFLPIFLLLLLLGILKGWCLFSVLLLVLFIFFLTPLLLSFSGFHRAHRVRHRVGREHRVDRGALPSARRLDLLLYREVGVSFFFFFFLLLPSPPFLLSYLGGVQDRLRNVSRGSKHLPGSSWETIPSTSSAFVRFLRFLFSKETISSRPSESHAKQSFDPFILSFTVTQMSLTEEL